MVNISPLTGEPLSSGPQKPTPYSILSFFGEKKGVWAISDIGHDYITGEVNEERNWNRPELNAEEVSLLKARMVERLLEAAERKIIPIFVRECELTDRLKIEQGKQEAVILDDLVQRGLSDIPIAIPHPSW